MSRSDTGHLPACLCCRAADLWSPCKPLWQTLRLVWWAGIFSHWYTLLCTFYQSASSAVVTAIQALSAASTIVVVRAATRDSFKEAALLCTSTMTAIIFALVPGTAPFIEGNSGACRLACKLLADTVPRRIDQHLPFGGIPGDREHPPDPH